MSKEYKKSVSPEDQAQINEFAREHKHLQDLKVGPPALFDPLQAELKSLEQRKANYNDASDELCLLDETDGPFAYKFGESFVFLDHDEVTGKLEGAQSSCEREMELLKGQLEQAVKRRDLLKAQLRSKFGDNIGLDDEDES